RVLSWRVSITMEAEFCIEALEEALAKHGTPDIFNTDQGSQFTSAEFTGVLIKNGIAISMRGFWSEVQRVYENRIRTSLPSSLRIAWKGVLKPRHFLGVRLAVRTMSWISSSDTVSMSIWRGTQRRSRRLGFSPP